MRILDGERKHSLWQLQLYLTANEAAELRQALDRLLRDPEANDHETVIGNGRELSVSVITPTKLQNLTRYTKEEQRMFEER